MVGKIFSIPESEQKQIVAQLENHLSQAEEGKPLQKTMPNGAKFKYLCTNLGQYGWLSDQKGYRYQKTHPKTSKAWLPIPEFLSPIIKEAKFIAEEPNFDPQSCLVNFYKPGDSLGLHQDRTEKNLNPMILSISLGHSAIFLTARNYKGTKQRTLIKSGEVWIINGPDRLIWHGIEKIIPDCPWLKHRINLTIRQVT